MDGLYMNFLNKNLKTINTVDTRFKMPFAGIVAGPQSSGKTSLLEEILKASHSMFDPPPLQIMYCYGEISEAIPRLQAIPRVTTVKGVPDEQLLEDCEKPLLLIFDDLMLKMNKAYLDDLYT